MLMAVHFTCVESLFIFTSEFSLDVVAMDTPLDVCAMKIVYYRAVSP